jgi:hypothetical protein
MPLRDERFDIVVEAVRVHCGPEPRAAAHAVAATSPRPATGCSGMSWARPPTTPASSRR